MAMLINAIETPEDLEDRRRRATLKRVQVLAILLVFGIIIRLAVKDPRPPKPPDHSKATTRIIPGLLSNIPEDARQKIDPQILAKLQQAEKTVVVQKQTEPVLAQGTYTGPQAPLISPEVEIYKLRLAGLHKKRQQSILPEVTAPNKNTLVVFRRGGYVIVQEAVQSSMSVALKFDRTMTADMPKTMVRSVSQKGQSWVEPIPTGYVRVTPKRGLSIVVLKETAKRLQG